MKKTLAFVLAAILSLSFLSLGAFAEEEVPVITIFTADDNVEYPLSFTDRPVLAKIAEIARDRFGIEVALETIIGSQFTTVLNTRLAAGQDMPDVVRYGDGNITAAQLINFYNQGLLLDLTDYTDLMPNYMAALENYPGVKSMTMDADGHILAIAQIVVNPQHITQWTILRNDWLEALDLAIPTTPDELYDVLRAFQENDMSGDGLPNEALQCNNLAGMNQVLFPAFGEGRMYSAKDSWWVDEEGKIYNTMVSDEAKEYVAYIAKLFEEGLIWQQSFASNTTEELTQFRIANTCAGTFSAFWDGLLWNTSMNGYGLKTEYIPIKPVNENILITNYSGGFKMLLTNSCPAPEKVIPFLDWFYTVEGTQLAYYGEAAPGGDYYVRDVSAYDSLGLHATDYEMVATDKYYEELAVEVNLNQKLGANTVWPHYMPGQADQVAADFYFGYDAEVCGLNCDVNYVMDTLNWAMENGYYDLMYVAADSAQADIISAHSDLFTFMEEKYKAFMSGVESLDGWDAFVETCYEMGLQEVADVMQARYDAYQATL